MNPSTRCEVHKHVSGSREWIKSIISYKTLLYSEQKQFWQIQFPPTEGDLHV